MIKHLFPTIRTLVFNVKTGERVGMRTYSTQRAAQECANRYRAWDGGSYALKDVTFPASVSK